MVITGKLVLVDLAGSEKVEKSRASGSALVEARGINKSLSALGNCIQALTKERRGHVPYRDSKLTHLLKDSLGGNTKTSLLVACSPHWSNYEETISSLRFATRAKEIKVTAKVNQSTAELLHTEHDEESLPAGLKALQGNTNTLFSKLCAFKPGDVLGLHHTTEMQHLSAWCTERIANMIQKAALDTAQEGETMTALRQKLRATELLVSADAQKQSTMVQAQRESEQRSASMAQQVCELEAECNRLRDQVEKLTDQNHTQREENLQLTSQPQQNNREQAREAVEIQVRSAQEQAASDVWFGG
eukprot:TRINITY_DN12011_c0_g2_i2.p1 TRINITY_DN12011_c0_g2~~TRINITY_DN12011_c0_g2_i2.p1  ORF type:complete len:302 (-),score=100.01 TRINITY_DN12011_c0_g2_i2:148-1053(-)